MTRILRLLHLRRNEASRVALAALLFLLVAANDAIVKSVAAGVFNVREGVARLPEMYTWIAVLFAATMVLLSYLTNKVERQRLLLGMFGLVGVVMACNTALLWLDDQGGVSLAGTGFYPFLFVSSEIARSLAGFQIWIAAGGICYASRARVIFPLLAAATTLGDVSGGLLVRFLGALLSAHQIYGLTVANSVVVIALLRPLFRRCFVASTPADAEDPASLVENLRYFGRSPYLKLLFLLSLAVFALYTAIHYGFNVVARQHYPAEGDITALFGLFFAGAGVATLLATTVLLRHVLRWLGVGSVYLWVCAVYLAITAVLVSAFRGIIPPPLIGIVLGLNLLNYVLLDSIIAPTYHVLMKLVPPRHGDGTRMIMEGGFMLLGGLLGAGVTALHAREVLGLSEFYLMLAAISAVMVVAGWRLKKSHTAVLIQAVREQNVGVDDEEAMQAVRRVMAGSPEVSRSLLLHQDDGVREMGIEMLRQHPGGSAAVCLPLIAHDNPRIRSSSLDALTASGIGDPSVEAALACLGDDDSEVRLGAARFVARTVEASGASPGEGRESNEVDGDRVQHIIDRVGPRLVPGGEAPNLRAEFIFILEALGDESSAPRRQSMLNDLLDAEGVAQISAGIDTARRLGKVAGYPQIRRHLQHPHPAVREEAVDALSQVGDGDACTAFVDLLADPDPDVVQAAVRALTRVDAERHSTFLLQSLNTRPPREWQGLLEALASREDEALSERLMDSCRQRLLAANQSLVAAAALGRDPADPATELLLDQLRLECDTVQTGVIQLLGRLGDVDVVRDLVERLSDGGEEAREHATELLENIGDRSIMELLLPLLSDDEEEALAAARTHWEHGAEDVGSAVSFALGSRDPWTRLAAAWAARSLGREDLLATLPPDALGSGVEMESEQGGLAVSGQDQPLTSMEKITFLRASPLFATLPLEELYHIALSVQQESVTEGTAVIKQGGLGDKMYIVVRGQMEVRRFDEDDTEGQQIAVLAEKQVFGDMALLDQEPRSASVIALEEGHLLSLQRSDLERVLRRYSSISFSMIQMLCRRLRESNAA